MTQNALPKPAPEAFNNLMRVQALALRSKDVPPVNLQTWQGRREKLRQAMFTALRAMKGLSTAIVDIASEPELPAAYRDCLMGIGVVSVYSMPLRSADNAVLGAIVSMFRRVRMPTAHQKALLDTAGRIVAQEIDVEHGQILAEGRLAAGGRERAVGQGGGGAPARRPGVATDGPRGGLLGGRCGSRAAWGSAYVPSGTGHAAASGGSVTTAENGWP